MSRGPRLGFAIEGGHAVGLGHVMRCAALAREATRWRWYSRAFLSGDPAASAAWREATDGLPLETSPSDGLTDIDLLVVDTPKSKDEWLDHAAQQSIPVVVLDDDRYENRADLTIHPGLHESPRETSQIIAGPKYGILSDAHRTSIQNPPMGKNRFLVSVGGSDPHRATERIAPLLASCLDETAAGRAFSSRDVVLGPAFGDSGGQTQSTLERSGWTVHRSLSPTEMATLMSESAFAVVGFGTSLTELAWHRTPFVSIVHHRADESPALRLEQRGIGRLAGCASDLCERTLRARTGEALLDRNWRIESTERAFRSLVGARGTERIMARFERLLVAADANAKFGEQARAARGGNIRRRAPFYASR